MKPILLISLLVLASCASQKQQQTTPLFTECPGLMPTPALLGKNESVAAFEVRIELAREEVVKRQTTCLQTVAQMRDWIEHNSER